MKTLTINLPDSIDISQERQFLAVNWYKSGKLSAAQAADVAGSSVAVFLAMAEPITPEDQLLKKLARPSVTDYDKIAIEQAGKSKKLDWSRLDALADTIASEEDINDLLAQISK